MFNEQMATATKAMETWQKPAKEAFDLWVSFFPVAPFFGVEWRFAESMPVPGSNVFMPGGVTPAPKAKKAPTPPAAKVALKVVETPAPKAAPAKPKPAPKAEVAPKVEAPKAEAPKASPKPAPKAAAKPAPKAEAPKPAPKAAPKPAAPKRAADGRPTSLMSTAPAKPDDLKLIKGIGPALEKQLNGLGIYMFEQIAAFDDKALAWVDDNLTAFKGRCFRDDWVGQAKAQLG